MLKIKILTWNIRHALTNVGASDIKSVIEEIKKHEADVVLLQEVDRNAFRSNKVDQFLEIKRNLGPDWNGVWTTRTKLGKTGLYGIATFSKFPMFLTANHLLSDIHSEKCIAQESEININGQKLSIVNVHMPYSPHTGLAHSEMSWNTLSDIEFPETMVIGGDFNAIEYEPSMRNLINECTDIGSVSTSNDGRIDYCLGKGNAIPIDQRIIRTGLSDHYPFTTTFILKTF